MAARECVAADSDSQETLRDIPKRLWQYFVDHGFVHVQAWPVMLTVFVLTAAEYQLIYNGVQQETCVAIQKVVCAHKVEEEEQVFVQLLPTLTAATPLQDSVQHYTQIVAELSVIIA